MVASLPSIYTSFSSSSGTACCSSSSSALSRDLQFSSPMCCVVLGIRIREFYYIQMEKYARQALAEGVKIAGDLVVNSDSKLYRVLVLHYNRNNRIEVN